jgi:hypothetical protein
MFEIIETGMNGRRKAIGTSCTFAGAKEQVNAMGVVYMEDDSDHEECADAFLSDGRVIAIQPEGFRL